MQDNVTATECCTWVIDSCKSTFVIEKSGYFEHKLWHFNS